MTYLKSIEAAASEWAVVMNSGPTVAELESFKRWLAENPAHQLAYNSYVGLWDLLGDAPEDVFAVQGVSDSVTPLRRVVELVHPRMVASIAALLVLGVFMLFFDRAPKSVSYITGVAENQEFTLGDGSQILLGAASEIQVLINSDVRVVDLIRGQAYFDVASLHADNGETKVPFVVNAGDMVVNVVGTEFDVNLWSDSTAVTVTEGKVQVSLRDEPTSRIALSAGQHVAVVGDKEGQFISRVSDVDAEELTNWRFGRLTYRDASLSQVVNDANRYRRGQIELSAESLERLRVTTSFGVTQIDEMVEMLEDILPVSVHFIEENNDIVITPES